MLDKLFIKNIATDYSLGSGTNSNAGSAVGGFLNTIFSGLDNTTAAEANSLTSKNAQEQKELAEENEAIKEKTFSRTEEIIENLGLNIESLEGLLEILEEHGADVKELVKRLEEQKEIYETNKAILDSDEATKEEKQKALEAIIGASVEIAKIGEEIQELMATIIDEQANAEEISEENEAYQVEADEVVEEGIAETEEVIEESADEIAENTQTGKDGLGHTKKGVQQEARAAAMASTLFGAGEAARLAYTGGQNIAGGGVETAKSAVNVTANTATIGSATANVAEYAAKFAMVGSLNSLSTELFGSVYTGLDAYITGFGTSGEDFVEIGEENQKAAEEMLALLDEQEVEGEENPELDSEKIKSEKLVLEVSEV